MKKKLRRVLSALLTVASLLCFSQGAMAADYSGFDVYQGLSGIQPGDTLTLPEPTEWATLTAEWGIRVTFEDWNHTVLQSEVIPEGTRIASMPSDPVRSGYKFTGWTRLDTGSGTATLSDGRITGISGPGTIKFIANYKRVLDDGQEEGTITVINTTHGNEYAGYRILDAEVNPDDVDAIIYTIRSDSQWFDFVQKHFDLTERGEDGTVTIYQAEPKAGFDPKTLFEDLDTEGKTPDLSAKTPQRDGVVAWDDVPFGYYAITSTLGTWVTVNTNNPDATVIDKNQDASLDKNILENGNKLKSNDASFGESVTFDIDLFASDYIDDELVTYYHIKDEISSGFDYDFSQDKDVTVSVTGTQEPISTITLTKVNSLSELRSAKSGYVFLYDSNEPRSFEVVVKWATLNEQGDLMPVREDEFNHIHVVYTATVNDDAVIAGTGNLNTASCSYDHTVGFDPEDPPEEEPLPGENNENISGNPTTTTYVYALGIEKVDGDNKNQHLPGVRFATTDFRAVKTGEGVYEVIAPSDTTSTPAEYFEIAENGFLVIKGLGSGSYVFREVYTLPGYNLLAEDLVITISASDYTDYVSEGTVFDTDCAEISKVENLSGIELPETGGVGTWPFIIGGVVLMLAAVILLRIKESSGKKAGKNRMLILLLAAVIAVESTKTASAAPLEYSMTYEPGTYDTVTNMPPVDSGEGGTPYEVSDLIPVRENYEFLGWILDYRAPVAYTVLYVDEDDDDFWLLAPKQDFAEIGSIVVEYPVPIEGYDPCVRKVELYVSGEGCVAIIPYRKIL